MSVGLYAKTQYRKSKNKPPTWLDTSDFTKEEKEHLNLSFGNANESIIVPGTRVKLAKAIHLNAGDIPAGTHGVVTKTDGVTHVVKFANRVIQEVSNDEIFVVGNQRQKESFRVPNRKRVVNNNKYVDRYVLQKMADKLERLANSVGMYAPEVRLLRSYRDTHDQHVTSADFAIEYRDKNDIRNVVTTKVVFDRLNNAISLPESFTTSSGKQINFDKKAVEELSEGRVFEPLEPKYPPQEFHYVHYDPARYGEASVDVRKHRMKYSASFSLNSPLAQRVIDELFSADSESTNKRGGTDYKFESGKYRDTDTGLPDRNEADNYDSVQAFSDSVRDFHTMDGRDEEKDKRERMEDKTFTETTATFDPYKHFVK